MSNETSPIDAENDFVKTSLVLDTLAEALDELGMQAVLLIIAEDFGGEATEDQITSSPRLAPIAALLAVVELCKEYEGRYHEGLFVNMLTKAIAQELKDLLLSPTLSKE